MLIKIAAAAEHIQTYLKPLVVMIQSNFRREGGRAARVDTFHIVATINERFRQIIVLE